MAPFAGRSVITQLLYAASQIAGAHDRNIRKSSKRTERLCLKRADKRDSDIDHAVCPVCGQKKADGQEQDFKGQYNVPPLDKSAVADMTSYALCQKNSQQKRQDGEDIVGRLTKIPLGKTDAKQNEIAGLTVGENASPYKISISVQESSYDCKEDSCEQCL